MQRGFVSFLFLFLVSQLLPTLYLFSHAGPSPHPNEISLLSLRRREIEMSIDEIIRGELHAGLLVQLPGEEIKTRVNEKIIHYLVEFPSKHTEPIEYELGFSELQTTHYLSLLTSVTQPLTLAALNQRSHVLVFPINQTTRYGEYAYTGGTFGTSILVVKMRAHASANAQTLFALPTGHRTCVTTITPVLPCEIEP